MIVTEQSSSDRAVTLQYGAVQLRGICKIYQNLVLQLQKQYCSCRDTPALYLRRSYFHQINLKKNALWLLTCIQESNILQESLLY